MAHRHRLHGSLPEALGGEMSGPMRGRLVDMSIGLNRKYRITVEVARELGIETDTPEQLARYKEVWSRDG